MTAGKLDTRDPTVHYASTTHQIEEENFQKDRVDATEALAEEAEKAAEAVAREEGRWPPDQEVQSLRQAWPLCERMRPCHCLSSVSKEEKEAKEPPLK